MPQPKMNDPPKTETMEAINFEIELSLKGKLQQIADETERSVAGLLRLIVRQYLDTKGHF